MSSQPGVHRVHGVQSGIGNPERAEWQLPALLSLIAGAVDVIGFLSLGLFTAHVTGNLVIIAAHLMRGGLAGPPRATQILAVPVFILGVAAVWFVAKALNRYGDALARPLLVVQLLLLTGVLGLSVIGGPDPDRRALNADLTAMMAVFAMACQFALLRIALPGAPSTAVMTFNLTDAVLSTLDTLFRTEPLILDADRRQRRAIGALVSFFTGCLAGAVAVSWLGDWAWSLPVVLAAAAAAMPTS